MKTMFYDCLPTHDGGWLLRCASNGRVVLQSIAGQSRASFEKECAHYLFERSELDRPRRLRVFDEDGREDLE